MNKQLKETIIIFSEKYNYLSKERFISILKINSFTENEIKDSLNLIGKGIIHFIINAPDNVINAILNYDFDLSYKKIEFKDRYFDLFVKIIYKFKDKDLFHSEEIDITKYEGNKILVSLYENPEIEIIASCRMTDEISKNNKSIKLYEGDLISTQDWGYRSKNNQLIMAFMDDRYINSDPYYKELLWTDKYGYLSPGSKQEPNLDNSAILLTESSFNYKEGRYNYHKITLNESFEIIGNINTHYNLLLP